MVNSYQPPFSTIYTIVVMFSEITLSGVLLNGREARIGPGYKENGIDDTLRGNRARRVNCEGEGRGNWDETNSKLRE